MPKRALPAIHAVLRRNPDIRVAYLEALAPESYYTDCHEGVETLYINPVHHAAVESFREKVVPA